MLFRSTRRTAFLSTLLVCLGFLFWIKFPYIIYDGRNLVSVKEAQTKYLLKSSIARNGDRNRLLSPQHLKKNPLTNGTRSRSSKYESSQNLVISPNAFEPEVNEDFQTIDSGNPIIPHIMHFIFITGINGKRGIPSIYKQNVLSFLHFNPNWTYYFWSDVSARELIATRQPDLLSIYDNKPDVVFKANALRYVLLYEFGGVYVDLDIKCMRPLDRATMKYACILTPEPFEHSAILYKMPYFFSNAVMLCRPKHPFFKQVIESLPKTAKLKDRLEADGTMFFTKQYSLYNKIQPNETFKITSSTESNSPYFYRGDSDHNDATYVANTHYFMRSFDFGANSQFNRLCKRYSSIYNIVKRGCNLWNKRKLNKSRNSFSFTDHNWKHMYSIKRTTQMIPIQSVIPQIKQYNASSKMLDI
ncbi:uncharacterized protein LOC128559535 [Mercenaria mercenaria]|uniref:uncharacterized protein LOC128559535 n=1 Tax=Mercenaria mercenaria TaxID=6596 RepID=UPI00234EFD3E|nr:uncharacterized protein LOC128559535 [Mercenaria mercenaria]